MKRLVGDRDEQTILSREWTKLIRAHDYNHLSIWIACSSKLFFAFSLQTFSDVHCDKIREKLMNMDFFFLWCKDNFESKVKIFLHFFTLIFTLLIKWFESETITEKEKFASVDFFICEKFSAEINQIFVISWRVLQGYLLCKNK